MNLIQKELLNMLIEVREILDSEGLLYSLSGGTLLGAARHKGFIPWDDDIDIDIRGIDFQKVNAALTKKIQSKYTVVSPMNFPKCKETYIKIVNSSFSSKRDIKNHGSIPSGLSLDIFPMRRTSKKRKSVYFSLILKIKFLKGSTSRKKKYFNILKKIATFMFSNRFLNKQILNRALKEKDGKYLESFLWKEWKNRKNTSFSVEDIVFEKEKFSIYKEYTEYLSSQYGDSYMEIPENKYNTGF